MLEFEKKLMLSKQEYETLCELYPEPTVMQTNFYYDTEDFLYNKKGVTCRIRKKGERYNATVKTHRTSTDDCSVERSQTAQNEYDAALFAGMNVLPQGRLDTYRKDILMPNGICVAIDKNIYLDTEDYELEIEYHPLAEPLCDDVIRTLVMKLPHENREELLQDFYRRMKRAKTKSERFFERKQTIPFST